MNNGVESGILAGSIMKTVWIYMPRDIDDDNCVLKIFENKENGKAYYHQCAPWLKKNPYTEHSDGFHFRYGAGRYNLD